MITFHKVKHLETKECYIIVLDSDRGNVPLLVLGKELIDLLVLEWGRKE